VREIGALGWGSDAATSVIKSSSLALALPERRQRCRGNRPPDVGNPTGEAGRHAKRRLSELIGPRPTPANTVSSSG
jgi:hypothetical protein